MNNNNNKNKRFARKPRRTSAAATATAAPVSSEGGVVLEEEKEEKNDVDDDDEIIIIEESLKNNKKKKHSKTPSKTTTTTSTKRKKNDTTDNNKSSDKNDPYSFENAKELFGKVDEEILVEDDDDEEEEDVDAQAEKYFVANRVALFGKALMIQKSNINKKSKEEEVKEVKEIKEVKDSIKEPTTKLINNKNRRVSFAMDQEEVKEEEVKEEEVKEVNKEEDKNEVLFDDALATEIKLTPEKPIQFKRQKTPSPVKQIIITKAVQSSDPQTHLQVLEKYGGGNGINNIIKNNFQEEEHRTLASTLWLLKKIASNTQYRRRLSRERPHFATSMFTAALKIAGKSATDAKLRLAAIALAYLFSLEIKTFSRVLDSMDIALGVAACVDEANFFTEEEEEKKEEIMVVIEDGTNDIDGDVEKAVETSLSALKFLPSEKSACTKNIALLLAFRALQWGSEEEEEKERREGGKQPPTTTNNNDTTSRALRTRLSRSGFITSVAKLANESCKDLVQSLHSSKIKSKEGEDKEEGEEMKVKARKACARLFRCARVIEAATYTSPETVTTLASSNLPVWESFSSSSFISDEDKSKDVEDDAFGEPSPTINNASSSTSSFSVLKLADVSLLAIEEEEEEEEDDVDDGRKMVTATATNPTTTTAAISTPPRPIPGSNRFEDNDDDNNTNNNSFLQIGSPATVGASPVFGQMAKSPGAALDSWLAKSPKDGDVDMSPKPRERGGGEKGIKNNRNDNNINNNSKKNNWSLARCLIETLPALTLLTSRSMRPRAKALHGIQTSEYVNPNIDARLSLATLKACVFALTNSTNENTVGAKAAASRDGLHGIIAAVAYFSAMRGCALYGEFAGFVPKKDNMEGTVPDAYKEAATELLHACMCLLVNITEANPRVKQELLQLQLDCSPFGTGKAEDFKKKKKKKKTSNNGKKVLDDDDEKSASPLVPFPTVLARIFTHAGGAKMHRVEDDDDDDDGDDDDQNQDDDGDDEDEEVTVEMLDDDDDATANAAVDPSYGEDLITQAYSSLLLAFLVENDREALRRTADQALPKGGGKRKRNGNTRVSGASGESVGGTKNGVQAMVDTLERFHAFHDTLDAMSASSSESLKRVVEWLKSTLV